MSHGEFVDVTTKCPECEQDSVWRGKWQAYGSGTVYDTYSGCACPDITVLPNETV